MNNKRIAIELLKREAVKLSPERKFVWASGIHSPIYCDNRKLLSFPESRNLIVDFFTEVSKREYPDTEVIAGVATGAIAWGALVAEKLQLPFIYVRSNKKQHGLSNRIEGLSPKNKKVLVIEDLISTGNSSLNAVAALRETGAEILGMTAIFTYLLPQSANNFKENNCTLNCLSDFNILISEAVKQKYISEKEAEDIVSWQTSFNKI